MVTYCLHFNREISVLIPAFVEAFKFHFPQKIKAPTSATFFSHILQDPVIFSSTLRANLDPEGKCSDESIWRALELAHLKQLVSNLDEGLQYEVAEGGDNFRYGNGLWNDPSRRIREYVAYLLFFP